MNKKNEFDLAVLNAYWMFREDLITEETLIQAVRRLKSIENNPQIGEQKDEDYLGKSSGATNFARGRKHKDKPVQRDNHRPVDKKKGKTGKGSTKYTPEVRAFIEKNKDMRTKELVTELNKRFNLGTTTAGIAFYKCQNGLTKEYKKKSKIVSKMGRPKGTLEYNHDQAKFLKECGEKELSDKEIIQAYNSKFKTSISGNSRALYNFMNREGMIKKKNGPLKTHKCEDCKVNTWDGWYNGKQLCNSCKEKRKKNQEDFKPLSKKEINDQLEEIGSDDDFEEGDLD